MRCMSAVADQGATCVQVHSMITNLAQYTDIRVALVVGGLSLNVQAATLRTSPEVVVATPVSIYSLSIMPLLGPTSMADEVS